MEDYLQKGGFKMQKMNNYKNNFYLYNKFDDNNYVIYAKTNGIRHLLKYHFGIDNNICPNELFILNYGNQAICKNNRLCYENKQIKTDTIYTKDV